MTPATLRLFVAAALSDETKRQIERAVAPLRDSLPRASWTRSESLHLTFAFLGDQDEKVVNPIGDELESRLAGESAFDLVVRGCGFFPDEKRARVAWLGLEPRQHLERISAKTRESLRARKIEFDEKKYVPHLTLARLRETWSRDATERFTRSLREFATAPARVDQVVLYKSQLSPKGAIHTPLRTVVLVD